MTTNDVHLRVLIADDELLARQRLEDLIAGVPQLECIGSVDNGNKAVAAIRSLKPDLVFLDIQMPGMSGMQVVREIGSDAMPLTIFVTAYDQYAIQAFDAAALDYLLKPFSNKRFAAAIERALQTQRLRQSDDVATRLNQALRSFGLNMTEVAPAENTSHYSERIAVESRSQVRSVPVEEIDYITASGVYAELHVGDKTHVVRESMQALEDRLDPKRFFRIHRSTIVQLNRINVLLRQAGSDYTLRLKNGVQLMVGRTRVRQLERWMGVDEAD
ncbi:MAG: LytTR family DNA-binding domain-containing protein [Steroidobacteraceae bacterium]